MTQRHIDLRPGNLQQTPHQQPVHGPHRPNHTGYSLKFDPEQNSLQWFQEFQEYNEQFPPITPAVPDSPFVHVDDIADLEQQRTPLAPENTDTRVFIFPEIAETPDSDSPHREELRDEGVDERAGEPESESVYDLSDGDERTRFSESQTSPPGTISSERTIRPERSIRRRPFKFTIGCCSAEIVLYSVFKEHPQASRDHRAALATLLRIPPKKIMKWFASARGKLRLQGWEGLDREAASREPGSCSCCYSIAVGAAKLRYYTISLPGGTRYSWHLDL